MMCASGARRLLDFGLGISPARLPLPEQPTACLPPKVRAGTVAGRGFRMDCFHHATRNAALRSKSCCRSSAAKDRFAGRIFGDVLFQFFTPQGLECPAAAIQGIDFGEVGKFAQEIAKINFTGGHTCVFRSHFKTPFFVGLRLLKSAKRVTLNLKNSG